MYYNKNDFHWFRGGQGKTFSIRNNPEVLTFPMMLCQPHCYCSLPVGEVIFTWGLQKHWKHSVFKLYSKQQQCEETLGVCFSGCKPSFGQAVQSQWSRGGVNTILTNHQILFDKTAAYGFTKTHPPNFFWTQWLNLFIQSLSEWRAGQSDWDQVSFVSAVWRNLTAFSLSPLF